MSRSDIQLIINADDLGYCEERDRGIVECFLHGLVTSVSLLANGQSAVNAIKLCKKHDVPIGLHLNLTEGRPVRAYPYKTLTNENNVFLGKFNFRERLANNNICLHEVELELTAQVEWFINQAKQFPTHADGHQHCHVLPNICHVVATVMNRFDLKWTRIPVEDTTECNWLTEDSRKFFDSVVENGLQAIKVFQEKGIKFAENFIGLSLMGKNMTKERIIDSIERTSTISVDSVTKDVARKKTCEFMVHPGYRCLGEGGCGQPPDEFSKSHDREYEMALMTDKELLTKVTNICSLTNFALL